MTTSPMFDPDVFANTQQEGEAFETVYVPPPEGDYRALIKEAKANVTPNGSAVLEVQWELDAPDNELAHEQVVRQSHWLDISPSGTLERGRNKNISLGRMLDALDLNGKPWSPPSLQGRAAIVKVFHEQDKNDPTKTYARVKSVARM